MFELTEGLGSADSRELTEWSLLYQIEAEEDELRKRGLSDDQIADVIEFGEADQASDDDEDDGGE